MHAGDRRRGEVADVAEVRLALDEFVGQQVGDAVERHREDVPVGGECGAVAQSWRSMIWGESVPSVFSIVDRESPIINLRTARVLPHLDAVLVSHSRSSSP